MKITKRYLERMIKEELKNVLLSEQWTAAQIAEFENTHMRDPDDREQAMGFDAAMTSAHATDKKGPWTKEDIKKFEVTHGRESFGRPPTDKDIKARGGLAADAKPGRKGRRRKGGVFIEKGQGYWQLAKKLGLDPRDKKIRGALRAAVAEKSGRDSSMLHTSRDYSWLKKAITGTGEAAAVVGKYGDAERVSRSGMTAKDVEAQRTGAAKLKAGDKSAEAVKAAATGYAPDAGLYTASELKTLQTLMRHKDLKGSLESGHTEWMGKLEKKVAGRLKKGMTYATKLQNIYRASSKWWEEGHSKDVELSSARLKKLINKAGVDKKGNIDASKLRELVKGSHKRASLRKKGETGQLKS